MAIALIWFRDDLRLGDNPALQAALARGYAVLPLFIHAPHEEGDWAPGAASDAWRARSLAALDASLLSRGSGLRCAQGDSLDILREVANAHGAEAVFWNRRYEPAMEARDAAIKRALRADGLQAESFNGALLREPWQVETQQGDPYKVFSAYWKTASAATPGLHLGAAPARLPAPPSDRCDIAGPATLRALRARDWDGEFWQHATPGEAGAQAALRCFIDSGLEDYSAARDRPALDGTSRLSSHLHFGEISVQRVLAEVQASAASPEAIAAFMRQLGWREFAYHLLHHYPHTAERNLNPRFEHLQWAKPDPGLLTAWQRGRTGIPIVDAGMRQLWQTGWMHNRVRMIVASVPDQEPAHALARRRTLVLGHAGRRRPRQQHAGLAMGRRHRRRCGALLPHLQPGAAGATLRPGRCVRAALAARAGRPARYVAADALAAAGCVAPNRPEVSTRADRRPGGEPRDGTGRLPGTAQGALNRIAATHHCLPTSSDTLPSGAMRMV